MTSKLHPLRFQPIYRDYIWGGTRLATRYGRRDAPARCAESWEIAAHPQGDSVVREGPFAGRRLSTLLREHGVALGGTRCPTDRFPLLMKLIDARERLSLQVHPDEDAALRHGGEPKSELWYILDAPPEAVLFAGLQPGVGPRAFQEALTRHRLPELLRRLPARPDRALFIPGGTLHAIGAGCLILEIQQSSDTTFRLYDWDRTGSDGRLRPLHLQQGIEALRWGAPAPELLTPVEEGARSAGGSRHYRILRSDFFALHKTFLLEEVNVRLSGTTFHVLFAADNPLRVRWDKPAGEIRLAGGESCLVPASLPCYHVVPDAPTGATLLTATLA